MHQKRAWKHARLREANLEVVHKVIHEFTELVKSNRSSFFSVSLLFVVNPVLRELCPNNRDRQGHEDNGATHQHASRYLPKRCLGDLVPIPDG